MNAKMRNRVGKLIICLLLIGLMPAYAQKKGKEKVYRLPDDLETLAGDPDLLKKAGGSDCCRLCFSELSSFGLA